MTPSAELRKGLSQYLSGQVRLEDFYKRYSEVLHGQHDSTVEQTIASLELAFLRFSQRVSSESDLRARLMEIYSSLLFPVQVTVTNCFVRHDVQTSGNSQPEFLDENQSRSKYTYNAA
jgi:hypothetical protein